MNLDAVKSLLLLLGLISVITVILFVALAPMAREVWCDGSYPVWMLQAQEYAGGGCVEVLPSSEAPPHADWRNYCVGLCNPAEYPANQDYSFGP